jgi:sugar/nucleoside kinase (ribokinase family)
MAKKTPKIVLGFNLYLEHILKYGSAHEKGRMATAPRVQLGSGAWNIAKTLEGLHVPATSLQVLAFAGPSSDPDTQALKHLVAREKIATTLYPVKKTSASSYYLIPEKGTQFAFGFDGGKISVSAALTKDIAQASAADIKIVAEIGDIPEELTLAKALLKRTSSTQHSILIPSRALLESGAIKKLLPDVTMLAMNEEEATLLLGAPPTEARLKTLSTQYVLVTLGPRGGLLKVGKDVFHAKCKPLAKPLFEGGAGDATTASLIHSLLLQGIKPQKALADAMAVGRATLLIPTPYWTKKK